jgi:GntR family negative regulator for fad regulon and positive regulator of fabA
LKLLAGAPGLADTPEAFAAFDWLLHRTLTIASGNPVYTLILNGFVGFYEQMARRYFADPAARAASRRFYRALAEATSAGDAARAAAVAEAVMVESLALWRETEEGRHETVERLG